MKNTILCTMDFTTNGIILLDWLIEDMPDYRFMLIPLNQSEQQFLEAYDVKEYPFAPQILTHWNEMGQEEIENNICTLLEKTNPELILIWDEGNIYSKYIKKIAMERDLVTVMCYEGVLPNTVSFEIVNKENNISKMDMMKELFVSDAEIDAALNLLKNINDVNNSVEMLSSREIAKLIKYDLYGIRTNENNFVYPNGMHKAVFFMKNVIVGKSQMDCMTYTASIEEPSLNGMSILFSLRETRNYIESMTKSKPILLVVGQLCFDHEMDYIYQIAKEAPEYQIIVLTEYPEAIYKNIYSKNYRGRQFKYTKNGLDIIRFLIAPELFLKNSLFKNRTVSLPHELSLFVKEKTYLDEACINLCKRHSELSEYLAVEFATKSYWYLNELLEIIKPKTVMMWNQFYAFHHILDGICHDRNLRTLYMEFGSLPGTYVIETEGQMGESYVAQFSEEFEQLDISKQDIENAEHTIDFLQKSRLSRRKQPKNDQQEKLQELLVPGRPIIFYAGQNDFESGIFPYTETSRLYHSPIFKSSDEAALFLAELSVKNEWNYIYKPHPVISQFGMDTISHPGMLVATDIDINDAIDMADVVVTILSQCSYVGLIRKKPVVMLGYTQLKGKEICYEAFQKEKIETTIQRAISEGYTDIQKKAFNKHVAQMLRYSLLDDMYTAKENPYGQNIRSAIDLIGSSLAGNRQKKVLSDINFGVGEIKKLIRSEGIKVISFDVFDTLLCRPVLEAEHLFRIVGERVGLGDNFVEIRTGAVEMANERRTGETITLDEIYDSFVEDFGFSKERAELIKKTEEEVEQQYLFARQTAIDLYECAIATNKPIYITSDMYLSGETIAAALKKNGITDYYKLLVSCEYHKTKRKGTLYQQLIDECKEKFNVDAYEILHIGDNYKTDYQMAISRGIAAVHFPSARECCDKNKYLKKLINACNFKMDNLFLLGYSIQKIFDDPFIPYDEDSLADGKEEYLAFLIYGPLMLAFVKWMTEFAIKENMEKIIFLLRDGYIPSKVYEYLRAVYLEAPSWEDMHLNRSMMYPASLCKIGSLYLTNSEYSVDASMTIAQYIKVRMFVNDELEFDNVRQIFIKYGYEDIDQPVKPLLNNVHLINELTEIAIKNASPYASGTKTYIYSKFNKDEKVLLFDTGYRGRASIFLKNTYDINTTEVHLIARPEADLAKEVGCMVKNYVSWENRIFRQTEIAHIYMDDVLSDQVPGVINVRVENGQLIWNYEQQDQYVLMIQNMQKEILHYVQGFVRLFNKDIKFLHFDREEIMFELERFFKSPSYKDINIFKNIRTPHESLFVVGDTKERLQYELWCQNRERQFGQNKKSELQDNERQEIELTTVENCLDAQKIIQITKEGHVGLKTILLCINAWFAYKIKTGCKKECNSNDISIKQKG